MTYMQLISCPVTPTLYQGLHQLCLDHLYHYLQVRVNHHPPASKAPCRQQHDRWCVNREHFFLYIWSHHYVRKDVGWGLFDHQKPTLVGDCFCWLFFNFLNFLLPFLLHVISINYFLLLKGGMVSFYYFIFYKFILFRGCGFILFF
jgi:hypothetical protein